MCESRSIDMAWYCRRHDRTTAGLPACLSFSHYLVEALAQRVDRCDLRAMEMRFKVEGFMVSMVQISPDRV